jgi:aerobic-type carbon monoxide dehydrogenase small subunit (CoxS/CutS family)
MRFILNRKHVDVEAPPLSRLLDVLREDCGLTGTKEGCGEGECGACTVLVDGVPVNACLVPFAHVRGRKVTTIEGVRSRVPAALVSEAGSQCGICTPGIVMAAATLGPLPTAAKVREALAGNLCRCTGYAGIVRALGGARAVPRPRVMPARQPSRAKEERARAAGQSGTAPRPTTRRKVAVRTSGASQSLAARRSEPAPAPAGQWNSRTPGQGKKASRRRTRPNSAKPRT